MPANVSLTLVEAREIDPPHDAPAAHWRLLTTHTVADAADARRIVGFYRQRWTIEQLFRTLKTHGFDVEALRLAEGGPFEKLVAASLIAAVSVLQLVRERDGTAKRPLEDAFDPEDQPALEAVSADLEGKTARQKNPHPKGSLAFAAWVLCTARRLDRLLWKTGSRRHAPWTDPIPRRQTWLDPPRCVNPVGSSLRETLCCLRYWEEPTINRR